MPLMTCEICLKEKYVSPKKAEEIDIALLDPENLKICDSCWVIMENGRGEATPEQRKMFDDFLARTHNGGFPC